MAKHPYFYDDPEQIFYKAWLHFLDNYFHKHRRLELFWKQFPKITSNYAILQSSDKSLWDLDLPTLSAFFNDRLQLFLQKELSNKKTIFKQTSHMRFFILFQKDFANVFSMFFVKGLYSYIKTNKKRFTRFQIRDMNKPKANALEILSFLYGYDNHRQVYKWLNEPQQRTKMPSFYSNLQVLYQLMIYFNDEFYNGDLLSHIDVSLSDLHSPRRGLASQPIGQVTNLFIKMSYALFHNLKKHWNEELKNPNSNII